MDKKELDFILQEGEGQFIEFKEGLSNLDKEIVAFANSEGGRIFLGISDNKEIKGIIITNALKSQIQDIARNCDPKINIKIESFENILIIIVDEGKDKPYRCSSGFYLRQGANSQKLTRDEIFYLFNKEGKIHFEDMINSSFNAKDLDAAKLNSFLSKAGISRKLPRMQILRNLSLINEKGQFKNASILFFGKNIERFLPQAIITCVLYKGKDKVFIIDKKDIKEDIITDYEEAIKFLYKNLRLRYEIKGFGPRKEILEIPEEALKEAVVNALAHRDYLEKGAVTMIEIFDDRVEISNPGGLIIKESEFGKRSLSRNPLIFSLLQRADLVEKVGSGIFRIREAMKKAGLKKPLFEFGTFFTIILLRPSEHLAEIKAAGKLSKKQKRVVEGLVEGLVESQKKILQLAAENPTISKAELAEKIRISTTAVDKNISKLKELGLLKRVGPDKGGHWEVQK